MSNGIESTDPDQEGRLALEMSGLRDEIERLERTRHGTVGAEVVMTALFAVGAMFMERGGTAWLLAVMWFLLTLRLVVMNRRASGDLAMREAALESLGSTGHGPVLPPADEG